MKKLSFENIKNALGRDEMKKIMAGSGNCQAQGAPCNSLQGLICCSPMTCIENRCRVTP
jgi:hypothetical protein